MLNPFYWYSLIWGSVLILYDLGLSGYNDPLRLDLHFFLIGSVVISFILGKTYQNRFKYSELNNKDNIVHKKTLTLAIVFLSISEFVYSRDIPLISILIGRSSYGDFMGLPMIHSLLENMIIFYSSYLFYLFLESRRKDILKEIIVNISMLLLMFHKGAVIFCLFIMINLFVAKIRLHKSILTPKRGVALTVIVLLIIYINGGMANLLTGNSWGDSEFITRIGGLSNWPSFIPIQFSWGYVYATSPLANLNLMLERYSEVTIGSRYYVSLLPVFFSKRLFPNLVVIADDEFILKVSALNACTGYAPQCVTGGIVGIWIFFFVLVGLMLLVSKLVIRRNVREKSAFWGVMSLQMAFMFFYNTITTAALSWLLIYIVLFSITICKKSSDVDWRSDNGK